ncbi:MAG: UDP-N-acetylmuramate dehydrogenase [Bacteroidetes bacterium]|jgi:UDP-N-acetylmuramate dehydrogenase|nr:UDP-N-acetylmuramate dehydrogenase [Bacteroidota bacterium]
MNLFTDLDHSVRTDEPLARHTWFRIGGAAQYFVEPTSQVELEEVVRRCRENDLPIHVLGDGANLLVADNGVAGAVIHLTADHFGEVTFSPESVKVSAGVLMSQVVLRCVREGRSGLEALTGIPGTVGGCVRMNAGGAFGDCGSAVQRVTVMDEECNIFERFRDDLAFAYRSTNITSRFVLAVEFAVTEDDPQRILKQVKQIWMHKKNSQPLGQANAGCIFKNPRGISAGALIDKAGLKGKRVGGAMISDKHANFIVTSRDATAFDVLKLIDQIRDRVAQEFGVNLEKEVEVW